MRRFACLLMLAGSLWLWLAETTAATDPVIEQFAITVDAQIDSRDPTFNFGVSTTAKVVVNGMDGSLVRSIFEMPPEMWAIPQDRIISAKVWYYVWFDQTEERTVRLHPLIRAFVEGTGDATAPADGATWGTYDGQNAWTSPGGDYDADVFVDAVEGQNWFSWDIIALWDNLDFRSFGALLKMDDESDPGYPNIPRAPFTSSDGPANERPYVEIIYQPVPTLCEQHVIWADADGDQDVDQDDFAVLQVCYSGSETAYSSEPAWCECLDFEGDGDIDGSDLTEWENCSTGPGIIWAPVLTPNCKTPEQ